MVLAEPGRVIPALFQNLRDGRRVLPHQRVVAGKTRPPLHDAAGMHRMVVAPVEKRGARGRAQSRRVEAIVTQSVPGQPFGGRRVARPAECARGTESDVIEQDEQDVGRSCRRPHRNREVRFRVLGPQVDAPPERLRRPRQDRAAVVLPGLLRFCSSHRSARRLASRSHEADRTRQSHDQRPGQPVSTAQHLSPPEEIPDRGPS